MINQTKNLVLQKYTMANGYKHDAKVCMQRIIEYKFTINNYVQNLKGYILIITIILQQEHTSCWFVEVTYIASV